MFLDIQLVKQIANNSVNVQKLNGLIKVTVELPSEFINKDGNIKKVFYFKILINNVATDIRIDVPDNHMLVALPISEFLALVSFGSTYTTSFCCK